MCLFINPPKAELMMSGVKPLGRLIDTPTLLAVVVSDNEPRFQSVNAERLRREWPAPPTTRDFSLFRSEFRSWTLSRRELNF